jgi:hypothetical protein
LDLHQDLPSTLTDDRLPPANGSGRYVSGQNLLHDEVFPTLRVYIGELARFQPAIKNSLGNQPMEIFAMWKFVVTTGICPAKKNHLYRSDPEAENNVDSVLRPGQQSRDDDLVFHPENESAPWAQTFTVGQAIHTTELNYRYDRL